MKTREIVIGKKVSFSPDLSSRRILLIQQLELLAGPISLRIEYSTIKALFGFQSCMVIQTPSETFAWPDLS